MKFGFYEAGRCHLFSSKFASEVAGEQRRNQKKILISDRFSFARLGVRFERRFGERQTEKLGPVRILIVDDFEPWRQAVCSILAEDVDLKVIAESSDGLEAVQKSGE